MSLQIFFDESLFEACVLKTASNGAQDEAIFGRLLFVE
jgi:hypothetical protein